MNSERWYVVMADRAHVSYPVAAFTLRDQAELWAGWCNRTATMAEYRVVEVLANPFTPAMRAALTQEKPAPFRGAGEGTVFRGGK